MNFGQWLKHLRKTKGMTLQQVGDNFGITRASVSDWETGKSKPGKDKLSGLARLYGASLEQLLLANTKPGSQFTAVRDANPPPYVDMDRGQVPYIAASQVEPWVRGERPPVQGRMYCPADVGPRGFVTMAHGVAMSPRFNEGEFLFVDPDETAAHGSAVMVTGIGEAPTVRQLQIDGGSQILLATNPDWPGQRLALLPDGATIAGVVIGKWVPE